MHAAQKTGGNVIFGAVGDVNLARECGEQVREHGPDWPFELMRPYLEKADLLFGNMESIVLPADYPDEQIEPGTLVTKFDGTAALERGGFDLMNMAANHVLDGGHVGMFHTQALLEGRGIATAGVGRTQEQARQMRVLEVGGVRFGFLCYCEDNNYTLGTTGPSHAYYTPEAVLEDIARHRDEVDVLVVSVHADLEFMETPSVPRREGFRRIARAGADMVLGHHPHVPQGVELVDGSLIAYSLGNFYFSAHTSPYMRDNGPHTAHSFLLLVEVSAEGVRSFERVPYEILQPPNQRPVPLAGSAAEQMLAYLQELDKKVLDDEIVQRNWREIALKHLEVYLDRIRQMDNARVLAETLGRLLLVAENAGWTREVLEAVREIWTEQQRRIDPLHRPNYAFTSGGEGS